MYRRFIHVLLLICCSVVLAACSQDYDELVHQVESTDLSKEKLNNVKLGSVKANLEKQGFKYGEDNHEYEDQRDYDRYRGKEVFIDIDRYSKKVVGVISNDEINFESITTIKGVKMYDDIKNVKKLYGNNYYTYTDEELGLEETGYIDKKNDIKLAFTSNKKGKVISIRLSVYNQNYE